jgi:hypothetical protein
VSANPTATNSRSGNRSATGNQLSLFSEVTNAEQGDNLTEGSFDDRNGYTHTTWTSDPGALETPPAPTMVGNLERENQLQQAIFAAQELTGNLLYELTVVQKIAYQPAWEIATREWAFLPTNKTSRTYCSIQRPSTRTNPCRRSPHNRRSRYRRGRFEAKLKLISPPFAP